MEVIKNLGSNKIFDEKVFSEKIPYLPYTNLNHKLTEKNEPILRMKVNIIWCIGISDES